MNPACRQTITQTLIQVRQNRLAYYSNILYVGMAVGVVICLFIGVHYWKIYSPRIQQAKRHEFLQLQLFRNAMRREERYSLP